MCRVRFLRFLMSTNVGSLFCLHWVKLFKDTKAVEGGTTVPYGRALSVPIVAKLSYCFVLTIFSARFSHVLRKISLLL
jgi:hypothetical protein